MDLGAYCREIEAHLCRRNGGHLVRVVGPAFRRVSGWAEAGVPLKVVLAGIDRKLARTRADRPSRRPLRIVQANLALGQQIFNLVRMLAHWWKIGKGQQGRRSTPQPAYIDQLIAIDSIIDGPPHRCIIKGFFQIIKAQ